MLFNKDRNSSIYNEIVHKLNKYSRIFLVEHLTNLLFPLQGDCCHQYRVLSEADRAQGNGKQPHNGSDNKLNPGWYRFQGDAGDRMPDKCVLRFRCGTKHPGWLNGTHPTIVDGVVTRTVCFSEKANCCLWHNTIEVKNCSSFYVYKLQKPPKNDLRLRYCGNAGAGKLIRDELHN